MKEKYNDKQSSIEGVDELLSLPEIAEYIKKEAERIHQSQLDAINKHRKSHKVKYNEYHRNYRKQKKENENENKTK